MFAFLAEHRDTLFPGTMFADMYPSSDGSEASSGTPAASTLPNPGSNTTTAAP
ncbi:hypothetical protein ABZ442_29610 [Streptomyces triculaminicus]